MLEKIIKIATEYCEEDDIKIDSETRIMEDLEMSSMEFFAFISDIETECKLKISESEMQKIRTIGDIVEIVER